MALKIKNDQRSYFSSNWELKPEKELFTHDDLIDAYLRGKEEQKNQEEKILIEKLSENIKKAQGIVETLTEEIIRQGFRMSKAYLRINHITSFDAILNINFEDFTSDNFEDIYTYTGNLKNKENSDTFYIDFTFMPHTKGLNENSISCDGYFFSYQK